METADFVGPSAAIPFDYFMLVFKTGYVFFFVVIVVAAAVVEVVAVVEVEFEVEVVGAEAVSVVFDLGVGSAVALMLAV